MVNSANLTVPHGETLSIGPGVTIQWATAGNLQVNGFLNAAGSAGDSIRFVHLNELQFSAAANAANLEFCVLEFRDRVYFLNHRATIAHCRFEGISGHSLGILIENSSTSDTFRIADCLFDRFYSTGLDILNGVLLLERCTIQNNYSSGTTGGGLHIWGGCQAVITDTWILNNSARYAAGMMIGGEQTVVTMTHCRVTDNFVSSPFAGGVMIWPGSRLVMMDCEISRNISSSGSLRIGGGGIAGCNEEGEPGGNIRLTRCLFSDNSVSGVRAVGGAIYGGDSLILRNCTFVFNWANRGGAIFGANHLVLQNSILERNPTAEQTSAVIDSIHESAAITYCDFGDHRRSYYRGPELFGFGALSQVNVNGDSCDPYHNLFLEAQFVDTMHCDYRLLADSPCIDAGDPASPRDSDGTVADMGVFPVFQSSGISPERSAMPNSLTLSAYPNPFNAGVMLNYTLERAGNVQLTIYDLLGREAATLASGHRQPGSYRQLWNASEMPTGIYMAVLHTAGQTRLQKLVFLK
jgi:hypothetical protein